MAFAYYKSLTLSEAQSGTADSSNWPLAICLDGNVQAADTQLKDTNNGGPCRPDGFDIRPYSDITLSTPLTYELVKYDGVNGKLEMHVKIPTLSTTTDTVIYLAYGDASLSSDASSSSTWSNSFVAVWHWKDGSTLSHTESSGGAYGVTIAAGTPTAAAGDMYGGMGMSASNNATTAGTTNTAAMSMSAWVKLSNASTGSYQAILSHYQNSVSPTVFQQYFLTGSGKLESYVAATGTVSATGTTTVANNTWTLTYWTYDSSDGMRQYVNGAADGTGGANGAALTSAAPRLTLGFNNVNGEPFNGTIDEGRISSTVRSASWVTADYNSQKPSSTFITWGTQTAVPSGIKALAILGVGK